MAIGSARFRVPNRLEFDFWGRLGRSKVPNLELFDFRSKVAKRELFDLAVERGADKFDWVLGWRGWVGFGTRLGLGVGCVCSRGLEICPNRLTLVDATLIGSELTTSLVFKGFRFSCPKRLTVEPKKALGRIILSPTKV